MSAKPFAPGQKVEAHVFGRWDPGHVYAVYDYGCDVVIGSRGCHYVIFENMRTEETDV